MNEPLSVTLTDDDIKHIFFQCRNNDPAGVYVGDPRSSMVDLLEYARKLEATIHARLVEGRRWPENFKTLRRL